MEKTVWITGASSGIGREFARRYAAMGCRLILTARRADRLTALAEELNDAHGTVCRILPADLADRADCDRLCADGFNRKIVRNLCRRHAFHIGLQRHFLRLAVHQNRDG